MQHVGLDLFSFGGKQHLICVDHWSGYPIYSVLCTLSFESIIKVLTGWWNFLGWPTSIRSDGGPQFCGDFPKFCLKKNIKHELSAPYNPKSNGLAEADVKSVKNIWQGVLLISYTKSLIFPNVFQQFGPLELKICTYICNEGQRPSRGPMSQPRGYHQSHIMHAGSYLCEALPVANFTLGS